MNKHLLLLGMSLGLCACTPLNAVKMDYQTVTVQSSTATPRMLVEKGRTQLDFGSGDRRLSFQFSPEAVKKAFGLKALADCTTAECLANFQLAEGTLQVGETVLQLRVKAESLKEDLSYALELIGLAENTRIVLQGKAYDPSGKVLGELNYNRLITQPVDRVTLEQMLNTLQTDINAKR
ncbi:MAG: hypothetical protein AB7I41_11375 [Candidatus Sericytochromatia bacterium]